MSKTFLDKILIGLFDDDAYRFHNLKICALTDFDRIGKLFDWIHPNESDTGYLYDIVMLDKQDTLLATVQKAQKMFKKVDEGGCLVMPWDPTYIEHLEILSCVCKNYLLVHEGDAITHVIFIAEN